MPEWDEMRGLIEVEAEEDAGGEGIPPQNTVLDLPAVDFARPAKRQRRGAAGEPIVASQSLRADRFSLDVAWSLQLLAPYTGCLGERKFFPSNSTNYELKFGMYTLSGISKHVLTWFSTY